ncbi:MAG: DEAD/DEAH box helicase family protein [Candidatus Pacearchaeota archaeon]|nr:DEAD/DEAH box helicase family protein [Candidatus Pacearchaeota archaeon]
MWSLIENGKELKPIVFSNNKTQEDVIKEIVKEIKSGNKLIFLKGVCGSGKSAIALNIAKELGRASIVVPIKNLQKQYEQDYTHKKQVEKDDGKKLVISMIKGRQNFSCPYFSQAEKIEKNSTLDIFDKPELAKTNRIANSSDASFLPCKVELKEKNLEVIRDYLSKNKNIKDKNLELKEIRRLTIASVCPYWSPIVPADMNYNLKDAKVRLYKGLSNKTYSLYLREEGCQYYNQYQAYVDSDAIIFNSDKYKIETLLNRKPLTDVEIIDECDEFLDSFSESGVINLNRLGFALSGLIVNNKDVSRELKEIAFLTSMLSGNRSLEGKEMIPLKQTEVFDLIKKFVESDFMDYVECDEDNYLYHAEEVAKTFYDFADETFLFFEKREKDFIIKFVTVDLSKRFKEMMAKNKAFVLMSGTLHSEQVLKDVFGLQDFKTIEAETQMPGKISLKKTGKELNCSYSSSRFGLGFRKRYLEALNECVKLAEKPLLVHVISFNDLPSEYEVGEFGLDLISKERLAEEQKESEQSIKDFKDGKKNILYSTRCTRGMDFPGETCNSIILTKYPYPDISSAFWKLLKKVRPEHYNEFYLDKARREFLQRVYRALRHKSDHVFLLSPDSRVFENFNSVFGKN